MKSIINRVAQAIFRLLKPAVIIALCLTLTYYVNAGVVSFNKKRYAPIVLVERIESPNGQWLLEVHKDDPAGLGRRGVFRVFRVADGQLELDFRVSRATLQAETQPFWIGDDLYFFRGGLEVIRFPASLWEKAWAYLP